MEKKDIIEFFDRQAPTWDAKMVKSDAIIGTILDNAEVCAGQDILDVACGTGVMFPYYLQRNVASVTGTDISPEMAKLAEEKFLREPKVRVICGDVEEAVFDRKFDRIVVYNAFPHFPDPKRLIRTLAGHLKEEGRLTIAHGASREAIDNHHSGAASKVSNGLMSAERLCNLFSAHLQVEVMISNSRMYQVSGVKPQPGAHSHGGAFHTHDAPHANADLKELLALMQFMVKHNDAHAQELAELALRLKEVGRDRAYSKIMDTVADFDVVNAQLDAALKELAGETL